MEKRKAATDIFKEQTMSMNMREDPVPQSNDLDQFAINDQPDSEFSEMALPKKMHQEVGQKKDQIQDSRCKVPAPSAPPKPPVAFTGIKTSEELQLEKEPTPVRETGRMFWRRIIVPPNAYVVHTRINRKKPVTLGLGVSFRYNPNRDAYLIIPAAMQTIGVVANCISKEKQGINILAYVQWQIHDIAIAYKKLDFSDRRDPLGIVNAQLREQAEAAIKDKIATMSVEEVLTDKAPIIEELTTRLREVTEGRSFDKMESDEGLGIKIVTVQIREAIVSSQSLWSNLQSPFRHEKEKAARISYLNMTQEITQKELETEKANEQKQTETMVEIESLRQRKDTEAQEIRIQQEAMRFQREQDDKQQKLLLREKESLEKFESENRLEQRQKELEAEKLRLTMDLEKLNQEMQELRLKNEKNLQEVTLLADLQRQKIEHEQAMSEERIKQEQDIQFQNKMVQIDQKRQEIRNLRNSNDIISQLVEQMPHIAAQMPEIKELKVLQTSANADADQIWNFIQKFLFMIQDIQINKNGTEKKANG